ncbi:uncharacterized protein LOC117222985 [Megalopta genalis]|uniref:uncharacterized protein LOC117222985 n=1 Tax=Megalopta genalis TaxID=115081 RepID=UPI003FD5EAE8
MGNKTSDCPDDTMDELDQLIGLMTKRMGKDYTDANYNLESPSDSFFLSSMFFLNITAKYANEDKGTRSIRVVVKRPPLLAVIRDMWKSDKQFHNEILFYEKFAVGHEDLPICYYSHENPPVKSVLVLENIEERGYHLSSWRYNVPMDYTIAAIQENARFHAKGYAMREHRRAEFLDFVGNMEETRFDDDLNGLLPVVNGAATRSVDYLRKQGHEKDFCDKLFAYLDDMFNAMMKCAEPEEPLATLCHGDFTLNNTFFKEENGKVKAMFIDFALMRYGSPVIDLSCFLSLHCAEELDKDMLESVLKAYNDSLIPCLKENNVDNLERFSYEALCDDYKKNGLFGYAIASFFLSTVMGKCELTPEDMADMTPAEKAHVARTLGGEEVDEILAKLLLNLMEFGCLADLV